MLFVLIKRLELKCLAFLEENLKVKNFPHKVCVNLSIEYGSAYMFLVNESLNWKLYEYVKIKHAKGELTSRVYYKIILSVK